MDLWDPSSIKHGLIFPMNFLLDKTDQDSAISGVVRWSWFLQQW